MSEAKPPIGFVPGHVGKVPADMTERTATKIERKIMTQGTIEVTLGEQLFAPIQFFSFRVGPYQASAPIEQGEDPQAIVEGLLRELRAIQARDFREQLKVHLELAQQALAATQTTGLGR